MPYCPNCGTPANKEDKFCSNCRKELKQSIHSEVTPTEQETANEKAQQDFKDDINLKPDEQVEIQLTTGNHRVYLTNLRLILARHHKITDIQYPNIPESGSFTI